MTGNEAESLVTLCTSRSGRQHPESPSTASYRIMTRVFLTNYPIPELSLRWLYVDFNSYFASVEQQLRPELRGKPIAVVAVETDSTCAIAASYEAKAFGVKTGTPIYEAKRLCPGLICVLARHECYVEFHHRLIEDLSGISRLQRFAPSTRWPAVLWIMKS